jgi:hypothetical protein
MGQQYNTALDQWIRGVRIMLWNWYNPIKGFDPLSLNPVLWLDLVDSEFTTESTDRVTQWNDISGNGNHATASSGSGARPTLTSDGVNFTGSQYLDLPSLVTTASYFTAICVVKPQVAGQDILMDSLDGAARFTLASAFLSGTYKPAYYTATWVAATQDTQNVKQVLSYVISTTGSIFYNGTSILSGGSSGTVKVSGSVVLGARYDGAFSHYSGDIVSIICYPYALTNTQRQKVENVLASKYEVSL